MKKLIKLTFIIIGLISFVIAVKEKNYSLMYWIFIAMDMFWFSSTALQEGEKISKELELAKKDLLKELEINKNLEEVLIVLQKENEDLKRFDKLFGWLKSNAIIKVKKSKNNQCPKKLSII